MARRNNKLNIAIFYDGNYMQQVARYYTSNNIVKYNFNFGVLHRYVISQLKDIANDSLTDICIAASHYYRYRCTAPDAIQRKNMLYRERITDDILSRENIVGNYLSFSPAQQKIEEHDISTWLAAHCVEQVIEKNIDIVVLVVSDSSYITLIQLLQRRGVDVMVVGWDAEMVGENNTVSIKTDDALFEKANHMIVVDEILNLQPEELEGMLIAMANRYPAQTIDENEVELVIEDDEERDISEILTLKNNYGFIRYPNNNLFFRCNDYIGDFAELKVGDTVEFSVEQNEDGDNTAKKVVRVDMTDYPEDEDEDLHSQYTMSDEELFDEN